MRWPLAALAMIVVAAPAPLLRTRLPERWRELMGPAEKARALVVVGSDLEAKGCAALREASEKAKRFGVEGMVVTAAATGCEAAWAAKTNAEAATVGAMGMRALIVDAKGVVRFERMLPLTATAIAAAGEEMIAWEQGRGSFAGHCGHCHGDDGAGTFFQGIKTMEGITTRMSDAKILEGGEQFGAVPISTWTKAETESLLLFVRGL